MYIGELILKYRNSHNPKMSQRAFAKKASLSPSYINTLEKIFNPKTGKPYAVTTDVATVLASAMDMSIEDLLKVLEKDQEFEINVGPTLDEIGNEVVSIPLIGAVKAGYNHLAEENIEGSIQVEKSLIQGNIDEYFSLRVIGDSMAPDFKEGDIVVVHKQSDCDDGQIAVVTINGDEGTLKLIRKFEKSIRLVPLNNNYGFTEYSEKEIKTLPVRIMGVVKQSRRNY